MKVYNMISNNGNAIANQYIIETETEKYFQSYDSIIAKYIYATREMVLDERYWDYSKTTGKYRNMFLCETKKETEKKIEKGIYRLENLN